MATGLKFLFQQDATLTSTSETRPWISLKTYMVGARGFEPPTPWSRTRCSTRLSHAPTGRSGAAARSERVFKVITPQRSEPYPPHARGCALSKTSIRWRIDVCVYFCVVESERWPSSS